MARAATTYTDFTTFLRIEKGVNFSEFTDITENIPFTLEQWAIILHLSERTLLRYRKENKTFDTLQSQQIIDVARLFDLGGDVFGGVDKFMKYLDASLLAYGDRKPRELLTSALGIRMVRDELTRIEHGIFA